MTAADSIPTYKRSPFIKAFLSLIIPGLGQVWYGDYRRGLAVFLAVATALATVAWFGQPGWYALIFAMWAWNVWDAARLPLGASITLMTLLWLAVAFGIGWQVTEINPRTLVENRERAQSILRPMLRPDFLAIHQEEFQGWVDVQVPCSIQTPRAENTVAGIHISVSPDCASLLETLLVTAEGLWPDYPAEVTWATPIGDIKLLGENNNRMLSVQTNPDGSLSTIVQVPQSALDAAPDPTVSLPHRIYITQKRAEEGYTLSENGGYILQGIYETLALALLATTLGAILALPLSFLAARNLMTTNPVTLAIYVIVRTSLNILRSIEALILAIIFVIIVGLGPFPGMIALTLHTTAALGKLFSEVIEGIDPGPIEAIRATGATWAQVVRYAVIPQIVPPFTALTIYRWDINVRSSTIIGFVGGGGIGFFLYQWIILGDYRAVSSAFIAIALVVILLDFFSARLRERLN